MCDTQTIRLVVVGVLFNSENSAWSRGKTYPTVKLLVSQVTDEDAKPHPLLRPSYPSHIPVNTFRSGNRLLREW